jgi:Sigma-70, region 4
METDLIPDDRSASYSDPTRIELLSALDEEIERLPEPYRAAVVLCDLAGLSHEEAARQFGCAIGTVGSRLARGRERLRVRLLRRGFAPAIGLSAASIGAGAVGAVIPPRLAASTVLASLRAGAGSSRLAGAVSDSVLLLAEGVSKSMVLTKLRWVAATTVTLGIVASGACVWGVRQRESEAPAKSSSAVRQAQTDKHWFGEGQNLLAILQAQVDARKAELQREEALTKLAGAVQARDLRLRERGPDYISDADLEQAAVDVRIASAQTDVVRAELREAEMRLEQAKQIVAGGNLEKLDHYLVRSSASASTATLERRIRDMERKLDQILEAMKK